MRINIDIEVLIVGTLFLIFMLWTLYVQATKFIYSRRYKPENDKARRTSNIGRTDGRTTTPSKTLPGSSQPSERILLQTADADDTDPNRNNSTGTEFISQGAGNSNKKPVCREIRTPFGKISIKKRE